MKMPSSSDYKISPLHLSESLQTALEAIQLAQQDANTLAGFNNRRQQRRRASLPAEPLLGALKRTLSHKRFPHLNSTKSIPFGFSPSSKQSSNLPHLHWSRSHCVLPHLPGTPKHRSARRGSLPADFKFMNEDFTIKEERLNEGRKRRGSYPLTEEMMKQRDHLHRCKAIHKANITLHDLIKEWKNVHPTAVKRVKSEPFNPNTKDKDYDETKLARTISMTADFINKEIAPSKNLIHIHFIDSKTVTPFSGHAIAAK